MVKTSFGEEPEPEKKDRFWVPPENRKDVDEGPLSDAVGSGTGNDQDSIDAARET
jgi:hypothetical protein